MNQANALNTSSDDRIMAAAAHFFGLIVAIIILLISKDRSRFLKYQAIQAMLFDLVVGFGLSMLFFLIFFIIFIIGFIIFILFTAIASSNSNAQNIYPIMALIPIFFPFSLFCFIMPWALVLLIGRLVAAINVLNGKDFRYPWLSKWVDRFMQENGPSMAAAQ